MLREVVLDTETTGLDPTKGDRVVEIGCVELLNHIPTGQTFHVYINPERTMPQAAFDVHGLSDQFLADKPVFAKIADDFRAFIKDARLVIHNAAFDVNFLNAELSKLGHPRINDADVLDTLALARRKHPMGPNSLDALCARYGIDNSRRTRHGALLDSEILAEVYIELIGGKQADLGLATAAQAAQSTRGPGGRARQASKTRPTPLVSRLTEQEASAHGAFVAKLGDKALWLNYRTEPED